jgi:diguanylate cyclase (GGDEF)-like protein
MMVDVDYFKRFNDTFGHDAGDAVLRGIGSLLRRTVREGDVPCRYGGEEFAVILPGADLADTRQRAEAIRTAIESWNPQNEGHAFGQVTVSIGIAALPLNGNSWQAALKVADEALYAAKRGGRNQVAAPIAIKGVAQLSAA